MTHRLGLVTGSLALASLIALTVVFTSTVTAQRPVAWLWKTADKCVVLIWSVAAGRQFWGSSFAWPLKYVRQP